jgi:hypothetical protein
MKDKLIAKLKQLFIDMKEGASELTLDIDDKNKDSVISELIVPFMQLTNSESISELNDALTMLIDGNADSEEYNTLVEAIVEIVMEDSKAEEVDAELETLATNAYAVVNKFTELKADKTNDEGTAFDSFSTEISDFVASLGDQSDDESMDEDVDDADDNPTPDNSKDEAGEGEEEEEDAGGEEEGDEVEDEADDAGEATGAIEIVASTDQVDETA